MTVRKKGNKWYCRFQIDGIRYERTCKGATTQKDAEKCEAIIKAEIMHGNYNFGKSEQKITLLEGLKVFENHSKSNKNSYITDKFMIEKILEYWGKNKILETITTEDINNFKTKMKLTTVKRKKKILNPEYGKKGIRKKYIYSFIEEEKTRTNATLNRYVSLLSKMFNLLIVDKKLKYNPCSFSSKLRENNFKIRYLTEEEQKRLFNTLNQEKYNHIKPIIICALYTGMRISEILALKWLQIDFNEGYINILKSKSGKERKIPLADKLKSELLLLKKYNDYVFVNKETQKPYTTIKHSFSSLLKESQIENFTFHDFRHTVATRLVQSGIDLLIVQELLGHADIKTTMRYAHPVPERKKIAINILNSY